MRIVFMGSSELSCRCLEALLGMAAGGEATLVGVVTQPDRPSGRGRASAPCPARRAAESAGLSVLTPDNVNAQEVVEHLAALRPDAIAVAAYGQMLKESVLTLPPLGCVNVHASLLPRYRGAAPIQWAIARGETETGVTTQYMARRMDAGDIVLRRTEPIRSDDTGATLHDRLALLAADLLAETLNRIRLGTAPRTPQAEAEATYAPKLDRNDGKLDWTVAARDLANRIRGFHPWPGCFCEAPASRAENASPLRLKVLQAAVEAGHGWCGEILAVDEAGLLVATGGEALRLRRVQLEGKRAMSGADYARGHAVQAGVILR